MSNTHQTAFGKFVPGFEFLQNLSQGAAAAMPAINNWVAPTLDPKELDKRIEELRAVQFWLDQNATALKATIQALEVQKMTLATLKGMNFNQADMAQAFKAAMPAGAATAAAEAATTRKANTRARAEAKPADSAAKPAAAAAGADPMQFWGALTQQFQQIAAGAMKEAARQAAAAPSAASAKAAAASAPGKTSTRRR